MTPPSSSPVRTVLFDVGGTLLRVQPSLGGVYSRAAADHGFRVDADGIERRFQAAWRESRARAQRRSHTCSDEILRGEWFEIVRSTFDREVPTERLPSLFEDLYERFVSPAAWNLMPGALESLALLSERGVRLGVLSNWDSRLPLTLEHLGLRDHFDFVVASYAVGYEKPHPKMFQAAIQRAGVEPCRILHVGDCWESDILPAQRLELRTLWVAPWKERAEQPEGGPGAESFAELTASDWEELLA